MDHAAARSQPSWPHVLDVIFDVDLEEDGPTRLMISESDALPRGGGSEPLRTVTTSASDSEPAPATPGQSPRGVATSMGVVIDLGLPQPRAEDGDHTLLGLHVPPPPATPVVAAPSTTEVVANPLLRAPQGGGTQVVAAPVLLVPVGVDTGRIHGVAQPEAPVATAPPLRATVAPPPPPARKAEGTGPSERTLATPRVCVIGRYLVGSEAGVELRGELGGELVLDRARSGPFADDPHVDAEHGALEFRPDGVLVQDFDSTNGVFVRVRRAMTVRSGDQIRVGEQLLRYVAIKPRKSTGRAPALGSPDPGYWGRIDVMLDETQSAASHPIDGEEIAFGQSSGELQFPDDTCLAASHARMHRDDRGAAVIEDCGSEHGTWLRLRSGDVVPYGSELLVGLTLVRVDCT